MSREILFRAKCIDSGEWKYGDLIHRLFDGFGIYAETGFYVVDPSTVCQYTGLTDRNGVKVYESDIIQSYEGLFTVDYCDGRACFMAKGIGTETMMYLSRYQMQNDFEVVGNRWDNLELLKEAAQYGDQDGLAPAT